MNSIDYFFRTAADEEAPEEDGSSFDDLAADKTVGTGGDTPSPFAERLEERKTEAPEAAAPDVSVTPEAEPTPAVAPMYDIDITLNIGDSAAAQTSVKTAGKIDISREYKKLLADPQNSVRWMVFLGHVEELFDKRGGKDSTSAFSKIKGNTSSMKKKDVEFDPFAWGDLHKAMNNWVSKSDRVKAMVFFGQLEEMFDKLGGKDSTSSFSKIKSNVASDLSVVKTALLERAAENAFQHKDLRLASALYDQIEKVALVLPLKRIHDTLNTLTKEVKAGKAAIKTVGPAYSMVREHVEGTPENKALLDPVLKALNDMRGMKAPKRKAGHAALIKALKDVKKAL